MTSWVLTFTLLLSSQVEMAPAPLSTDAAPPETAVEAAEGERDPGADDRAPASEDTGMRGEDGRFRILVLRLTNKNVSAAVADTVESVLTVKLSSRPELNVVSRADLKAALSVEADRIATGCDESGCLAEIAGALDARLVVYGEVAKLDEQLVITVNLFDAVEQRAIARESMTSKRLSSVTERLTPLVANLLVGLVGGERTTIPVEPDEGFTKDDYIRIGGITAGLGGVGLGAVGFIAGTTAYMAELISLVIDEPYTDLGYVALITPIAGPILYLVVEPYAVTTGLQFFTLALSFGFQMSGAIGIAVGAVVAGGGFAAAWFLPGGDAE